MKTNDISREEIAHKFRALGENWKNVFNPELNKNDELFNSTTAKAHRC